MGKHLTMRKKITSEEYIKKALLFLEDMPASELALKRAQIERCFSLIHLNFPSLPPDAIPLFLTTPKSLVKLLRHRGALSEVEKNELRMPDTSLWRNEKKRRLGRLGWITLALLISFSLVTSAAKIKKLKEAAPLATFSLPSLAPGEESSTETLTRDLSQDDHLHAVSARNAELHFFSGTQPLTKDGMNKITLSFTKGRVLIRTIDHGPFAWNCHHEGTPQEGLAFGVDHTFALRFDKAPFVDCTLSVPRAHSFTLDGDQGIVELDRPKGMY